MGVADGDMAQANAGKPGSAGSELSFAELLRAYRKAAKLTQDQLAERAGYSTVYVSMLERGQRSPLETTAAAFAAVLALNPRDRSALERASATGSGKIGGPDRDTLIGRVHEMAVIERHLSGEGPPVLLVAGEPGIGKSRLLREASARAGRYGLRSLEGECFRRGADEPFTPILQALQRHIQGEDESRLRDQLKGCSWLVRLLPELAGGPIEPLPRWTVPGEHERRLMDDAVARFLGNVAGPQGTLLVLDDLQWASTDALNLIQALCRSSASIRILGAYRENELGKHHPLDQLLADLAHGGLLTRVSLGPVSEEEAASLLEQLLSDIEGVDSDVRQDVLSKTDGVPFFVVSCSQALRTGAVGANLQNDIPWDLAQSVRQRMSMLSQPTQELLGRAAVAGPNIPLSLLTAIGVSDEATTLSSLDAASEALLLEETGRDTYRFAHDVIREVIEADLGSARRTVLHRQIGEALERRGGTVEALAYHFARSTHDDKAVEYLEKAGEAAENRHANAMAEGYYRELLDRLVGMNRADDASRAREKLGRILTTVGRYDEALAMLEQAAGEYHNSGEAEGQARVAAQIGRLHGLKGSPDDGIARLEPLRLLLERAPPTQGLAELNAALAPLFLAVGRYGEQLAAAERAVEIATSLRDDQILAEAEVLRGCALNQLGNLVEGRRVLESSVPLAENVNDLSSTSHALNDLGYLCEIGGQFTQSRGYKLHALEVARRVGDPAAIANMSFRCGQNAFLSGEWLAAQEFFEQSVTAAAVADTPSVLAYPLFGLGLLALLRGEAEAAAHHAGESLAIATRAGDIQVIAAAESVLADLELQVGKPADARARLEVLKSSEDGLDLRSIVPTLAEACMAMGDLVESQKYLDAGLRKAETLHNLVGKVDLLRVQALVLIEQHRWEPAESLLQNGLELARSMPYPYAIGSLLYSCGLMAMRMGDDDRASRSLDEAFAILQKLGAARLARKVAETLVSASVDTNARL